jgi:hypothetical protein
VEHHTETVTTCENRRTEARMPAALVTEASSGVRWQDLVDRHHVAVIQVGTGADHGTAGLHVVERRRR